MRCPKCSGCVVNDQGDVRCLNCGHRPLERRIEHKCAWTDCLNPPTKQGYCEECFGKRERSDLTPAEREQRRRDVNRASKQRLRAKRKGMVA